MSKEALGVGMLLVALVGLWAAVAWSNRKRPEPPAYRDVPPSKRKKR